MTIILRHQEVCGIIIEIKKMMMLMKILLLVITGQITTRQPQVDLLSIIQK